VEVSPRDLFGAADWLAARLAHMAASDLGSERFLYLIRDQAPPAIEEAPWRSEVDASFRLPHHALFSTEPVRSHFRANELGVYGPAAGGAALCFDDPMLPQSWAARPRRSRRLLFYAPLEQGPMALAHLGVFALQRAAKLGLLDGWEVNGVGVHAGSRGIELGPRSELVQVDVDGPEAWSEALQAHHVGLALGATIRPSLASFEMAAAGLVTVTNTFGAKDATWLARRSPNLIAVEPTIAAILEGLQLALARAGEAADVPEHGEVRWPTSWSETFHPTLRQQLAELIDGCIA
jgi:hypothetical protein